jgi:hypothetical protein
MTEIQAILRSVLAMNQGNRLTPELALGIEQSIVAQVTAMRGQDNALALRGFVPEQYRDVVFAVERMDVIRDEIAPLHWAHWQESESSRHELPYNPNYDAYVQQERTGSFMVFTVRDAAGALKGYMQMYIGRSNHTGVLISNEDALFLDPEVRKGFICRRFAAYAEQCLRALGVREVRLSVKNTNGVWKVWERMGFAATGVELVKILED